VLLASGVHNSAFTRVADTLDGTGQECFINHVHIKSLLGALELARQLTHTLTKLFKSSFAVIRAFDGTEATVQFHKFGRGRTWLSGNLEQYEEGLAVLASS
jgi:hypothetical protein